MRWLVLLVLVGCASSTQQEGLDTAVQRYNEGLRWKRFADSARYLPQAAQSAFMRRYLAREADLRIDSLEVRDVRPLKDTNPPAFEVTVVVEAYVLPSTVLERRVQTQRWELLTEGGWQLASVEPELIPDTTPSAAPVPAIEGAKAH